MVSILPVPVPEATAKGPSLNLQDLLGRIAEHTDDVILITEAEPIDLPGPRIVYVNAAFTRMTGCTSEEAVGLTPRILQGPKTSRGRLSSDPRSTGCLATDPDRAVELPHVAAVPCR